MPKSHKPSKVSQAVFCGDGGKYSKPGDGYRCSESPTKAHWWCIGSSFGRVSTGVCRYCGEEREFANTMEMAVCMGKAVK